MKKVLEYIFLVTLFLIPLVTSAQTFISNTNGIPISITNGATVFTNGTWVNTGPVTNNGKIITSENWTNTGTMSGTGGFVLDYTVDHDFRAGSNSATIGFIEKNGTGIANLSGKVYVRESLKVASGTLRANSSADTVGLLANTLIFPGTYVQGPVARKGTGTLTLPTGLGATYLPITFYNPTSSRVGAVVEAAPVGYEAGDAVRKLVGFPFVWKTDYPNTTDTARYVEVQVPDVLLVLPDSTIVTQKAAGLNQYEALGNSEVTPQAGTTSFKSFSRAGENVISLGIGYPGTPDSDRIALAEFYDATNGPGWTTKINWKVPGSEVRTWTGIKEKGGRIIKINLQGNKVSGDIPVSITNLNALKEINLAGNYAITSADTITGITYLPDLTSMPALQTVNVSGNSLTFDDLETNADLIVSDPSLYTNQAPLAYYTYDTIAVGGTIKLELPPDVVVGGTVEKTNYQWKYIPYYEVGDVTKVNTNSTYIPAPGVYTQETYTTLPLDRSTIGKYRLFVTNDDLFYLENSVPIYYELSTQDFELEAVADISGKFNFGVDSVKKTTRPNDFKEMRLVQVTTGAYDTIRFFPDGIRNPNRNGLTGVNVKAGSYDFKKVLLRDYLINGFADTALTVGVDTIYKKVRPTWYTGNPEQQGTFYWEEVSKLVLLGDSSNRDIVAQEVIPDDPGIGTITGTLYGVDTEGGRVLARDRVKKAPVTVRRQADDGRGNAETYITVAYLFTKDDTENNGERDGEFTFEALQEFEYLLNFQYPGLPMDEDPDSYIHIPIVDNLFGRYVAVEAYVENGKIFVQKMIVTGWEGEPNSMMTAYPNPTVEFVYVKGLSNQSTKFSMVDSNGRTLLSSAKWNAMETRWEVDVRELKRGVYILQVEQNGSVKKLRIMVQ